MEPRGNRARGLQTVDSGAAGDEQGDDEADDDHAEVQCSCSEYPRSERMSDLPKTRSGLVGAVAAAAVDTSTAFLIHPKKIELRYPNRTTKIINYIITTPYINRFILSSDNIFSQDR